MKLEPLPLEGAFKVSGSATRDNRGSFSRLVDLSALPDIATALATGYLATASNLRAGTIRGLHFQAPPHGETKLVWCTSGSVFDVLVDMRSDQPSYGLWVAETLSPENAVSLIVPPGVAHGYQTLMDNSTVAYLIDGGRESAAERTVRWDDPTLGIPWPRALSEISGRDSAAAVWSDLA